MGNDKIIGRVGAVSQEEKDIMFEEFNERDIFTEDELNYMDFLNRIIMKLVSKRLDLNITQQNMAKKIGVSNVSLCRIETFAKKPSLLTLYKMATYLGMELDLENSTETFNS
jgi:DNA-binding XRE family transcriptional regulator